MSDPRLGEGLLAAIRKLPAGSGVVFRHYELSQAERLRLFRQVRRICRQRGHVLLVGGDGLYGGDGVHGRVAMHRAGMHSAPVHDVHEIAQSKRFGVDLMFLSPLYPTHSHPGAPAFGLLRFGALARLANPAKVIALGGMTRYRAHSIMPRCAYGWAAIDAFKK